MRQAVGNIENSEKSKCRINQNIATYFDKWLTKIELADYLGKSTRTIERWVNGRKSPPFTKVGNTTLFHIDGVEQWLKGHEVNVTIKTRARNGFRQHNHN